LTEVDEDVDLGVRENRGDGVDVTLSEKDTTNTVAETERVALDVPEFALDGEITVVPVAVFNTVVVLEIEAHDETVEKTEVLRDFIALKEMTGLCDESTDADEDGVILSAAIDERDNISEDVDSMEANNEMLS
jgi:hypothetical protein